MSNLSSDQSNANIVENVNLNISSQAVGTIIVEWDKEISRLFCIIRNAHDDIVKQLLPLNKEDMESFK